MDRNILIKLGRLFFCLGIVLSAFFESRGQNFSYTTNALSVDITVVDPCMGDNGAIKFTIKTTTGEVNAQIAFLGSPVNLFPPQSVAKGASFTFNGTHTLKPGSYNWIVSDGTESIGSLFDNVAFPPLILTTITTATVSKDLEVNNTSCSSLNGAIQASISGGSKALPGGGIFKYTFSSSNGLAGLPFSGTTDGTTPLNLATLLGIGGLPGGTYTLVATDSFSFCGISNTVFTITDPSPLAQNISPTGAVTICNGNDAVVNLLGSESFPVVYEIFKNNVSTGFSQNGTGSPLSVTLPKGNFITGDVLTVRAKNQLCTPTDMIGSETLTVVPVPTITSSSSTDITCNGVSNGSITVVASGGMGALTYTLNPGAISNATGVFSGLTANTYTVTVTDINTCGPTTSNIVIAEPALITFSSTISANVSCHNLTDGSIAVAASGGTGTLTYTLNPGAISNTTGLFPGLAGNTYTVSVTDANSCGPIVTPNIVIVNPPVISITSSISANATCNGGSNGSITVVGAGGTGTLTYTLSPGAISNTTGIFSGLTASTYTVSITDVNSCTPAVTPNIIITQPPAITISSSASTNVTTCAGGNNGSITVAAAGGTGTLTYTLNPGAISNTTGIFSTLTANTYTVSITDINSCGPVITPNIVITEPAPISITSSASVNVTCNGGSNGTITVAAAGGTGTLTYTLNPGAISNTTGSFTNLSANTYTVSVTDVNGCGPTVTPNIIITNPSIISITSSTSTNVSCNAGNNGTITVAAAGGTGTLTYTLNPGAISNSTGLFSGLAANTYTVSITDANACGPTVTPNIIVTQPVAISITSSNSTNVTTCFGGNNGTITVVGAGGTGTLTYTLNPGAISNTTGIFNSLTANTYTVSITDLNSCGPKVTPNIVISQPPVISITSTLNSNISCNGLTNGSIAVTATGGTGTLTYTLNPGAISNTTGVFNSLAANTYTVSVTDINACGPVVTPNIIISQPLVISISSSASTDATCNGVNNGTITIVGAGGTGTLTYTLNPGAISNTTGIFSGLAANTYTVSITDVNSCGPVATPNIIIAQPPVISITSSTSTNVTTCFGGNNGSINVAAAGGTGTLTYTLNPGALSNTTGIFNSLTANTYTVSITDGNACGPIVTPNIVITQPPVIAITSSSKTNVVCNGGTNGTISVAATGGTGTLTYTLNPGAISNTTGLFSGLSANTYTVSISDINGCGPIITPNIIITNPPVIAISSSSSTNVTCNAGSNGSITVVGTGGTGTLTYTLNPGAISNTTGVFNSLTANTYTVSITDINACGPIVTPNIIISEPAVISITSSSSTDEVCNGGNNGTITVSATGGTGTLTYTLNPGAISNTTGLFTGLAANTYSVSITDASACGPIVTPNIFIAEPAIISITSSASTNVNCNAGNDGTITVAATGGTGTLTYTLNPGAVSNTTGLFLGLTANTYTVSITDANACGPVVTPNIIVTQPSAISISSTANTNLICNGDTNGTISIVAVGGTGTLTYTLNPGAISNTTGLFSGLAANTYTVSITDANACGPVITPNIIITEPAVIAITSTVSTNVDCNGGNTGTITISASGGTGTLTYTLNPGAVSNTTGLFSALTANTYTVSITDANACGPVVTPNISITEPAAISITSTGSTDATCSAGTDGTITVVAAGGTGVLTYTLSPGAISNTTGVFTGLSAGTYTVSITDANLCSPVVTPNIVIAEPTTISISSSVSTNVNCNGGTDGTITVVATGGTGTLTFTINPGAISNTTGLFSGLVANTYTVSITDGGACSPVVTPDIIITEPVIISITSSASANESCNAGNDGTITIVAAGGTGTLTYTLNPGAISNTTGLFTGLVANAYTVSITDVNTCGPVVTPNIDITEPVVISITSTARTDANCNAGSDGTITVVAAGGTGALTYTLSPGAISNNTGMFSGLTANTYTVSITDANNCGPVDTANIIIAEPPAISITSTNHTDVSCNAGSNGAITVAATGGTGTLTYTLNPGAVSNTTGLFTTLSAGTYTVSITDDNTCGPVVTANIIVTEPPAVTATLSTTTPIVCNGTPASLTINFGGAPISSSWTFVYTDGTTNSPSIPSFFTSITFPVNPTTTTTYSLVSVVDNKSCVGTVSGSPVVTVNNPPDVTLAVAATINPLCFGGSTSITIANSENGVNYQLRDASNAAIGSPVVGNGATISLPTGVLNATTTFNVLASVAGCASAQLNNTVTVTVSGNVNAGLAVAALVNPICSGSAATIRVTASETGVLYQLRNDTGDVNIGSAVAGTGLDLDLPAGSLLVTTTFNVLASNGTCSIELTDLETVNVDVNPDGTLPVSVTIDPVCTGGVSSIQIDNSENGVSYQLRDEFDDSNINTPVVGTGGTIVLPTTALTITTTFNILATGGAACTAVELSTLPIVNVNGTVDASLAVTALDDTICVNTGTSIRVTASEVGVNYQLRDDNGDVNIGLPMAGTGLDLDLPTGNLASTTIFNVLADNGSCSIELATLDTVNIEINPNPSLTVLTTINPLCVGGSSGISIQNSEIGVTYQLRDESDDSPIGSAIAGTGATITLATGPLAVTTTFNVLASSGTACPPIELTTTPIVTVNGSVDASLITTASPVTICANGSAFVQIAGSELNVNYQLRKDVDDSLVGTPVAGTGLTINIPTGNLVATTIFNVLASNGTCSIELADTVQVKVKAAANPALTITANPNPVCSGTASTITVLASEIGITYELRTVPGNVLVSTVAGTGGNISFSTGALLASTNYKIMAIVGTCTVQLTTTPSIIVRPVGDPACSIVIPPGCASLTSYDIIPTLTTCANPDQGALEFRLPATFDVILQKVGDITFNQPKRNDTIDYTSLKAGDYIFTIKDLLGNVCINKDTFTLERFTQVKIDSAYAIQKATCFGGIGNLKLAVEGTTTGKYFFSFVNNGIESAAQEFTPGALLPGGLPANDNDFIILKVDETIGLSCPDTVMINVKNLNPKLGATYVIAPTTCSGSIGSITGLNGTGGNGSGYTFILDGTKSEPFTELAGGAHYLTIQDGDGTCSIIDTVFIPFPGQVDFSVSHTNASCSGNADDAKIRVDFVTPDTYEVGLSDDPQIEPDTYFPVLPGNLFFTFNNLSRGSYYVFVKGSTSECATPSLVETVGGAYAIDFDFESICQDTVVSVKLTNITYDNDPFDSPGSLTLTILDNTNHAVVNELDMGFPINGELFLDATNVALSGFFNREDVFRITLKQLQGACEITSETHEYEILPRLRRPTVATLPAFEKIYENEIGIGQILFTEFTGGLEPYHLAIEGPGLDSFDDVPLFGDKELKYSELFPGSFTVNITDSLGCALPEFVVLVPKSTELYIPNIFTPNGDGKNDDFAMRNVPEKSKIVICDRWGKQVFTSNDYKDNWWTGDGVSDGVYYYSIKIANKSASGWVEVLRGERP